MVFATGSYGRRDPDANHSRAVTRRSLATSDERCCGIAAGLVTVLVT
jgi:hypothetical protein